MASYQKANDAPDYDADATNSMTVTQAYPKSGLSAGVESGLSMTESLTRGETQAQQKTSGLNYRKNESMESGGSKNGKSFTFRG